MNRKITSFLENIEIIFTQRSKSKRIVRSIFCFLCLFGSSLSFLEISQRTFSRSNLREITLIW